MHCIPDASAAYEPSVDADEVFIDLSHAERPQYQYQPLPFTDSSRRRSASWRSRTPISRTLSTQSTSSSLFLDQHLEFSKSTTFTSTSSIPCKYKCFPDKNYNITTAFGIKFKNVHGIASSPWTNDIYVVDSGNDRVVVLNQHGRAKLSFGGHGLGKGEFDNPRGIAISDRDEIIVADSWNDRVHIFDINGHHKRTIGALKNPVSVACIDGLIFVCDAENIQSFRYNGQPVKRYPSNILNPAAVARGPNNTFVILDAAFHKIHKFSINGLLRECINLHHWGWWNYKHIPSVTVDDEGFTLVTRPAEERIDVFTPVGNSRCCSFSYKNLGPVFDIAVLNDGRLAAACESKVIIFDKVEDATFYNNDTFCNDRRVPQRRDATNVTRPVPISTKSRSASIRDNCLCC